MWMYAYEYGRLVRPLADALVATEIPPPVQTPPTLSSAGRTVSQPPACHARRLTRRHVVRLCTCTRLRTSSREGASLEGSILAMNLAGSKLLRRTPIIRGAAPLAGQSDWRVLVRVLLVRSHLR